VAFEPFARLFNPEAASKRINVRCAILTDDDRTDSDAGNAEISSRAQNATDLKAGLLAVFLARRTFEYELFLANEDLVLSTYRRLHPRTDFAFAGTPGERAVQFATKVRDNRDKAVLAQNLANRIDSDSPPLAVPDYIQKAIRWAAHAD